MPIETIRHVSTETYNEPSSNARLQGVKGKDGHVQLYYSTKPLSLKELITGKKAKTARKELTRLIQSDQEMGASSGNNEGAIRALKVLEGDVQTHNVKHALRPHEVQAILEPIFIGKAVRQDTKEWDVNGVSRWSPRAKELMGHVSEALGSLSITKARAKQEEKMIKEIFDED